MGVGQATVIVALLGTAVNWIKSRFTCPATPAV